MKDLFGNKIQPPGFAALGIDFDAPLRDKIKWGENLINQAIREWKPIFTLVMVSGGHDSLSCLWLSANHLQKIGAPFAIYHGNTTIPYPKPPPGKTTQPGGGYYFEKDYGFRF